MGFKVTESTDAGLARARSCDFKQKSEQSVCIGLGVVSSIFQCSNLQKSRFCLSNHCRIVILSLKLQYSVLSVNYAPRYLEAPYDLSFYEAVEQGGLSALLCEGVNSEHEG